MFNSALFIAALQGSEAAAAGETPVNEGLVDNHNFGNAGEGWTFTGNGSSGTGDKWDVAAGTGFKRALRLANATLTARSYWYSWDLVSRTSGTFGTNIGTSSTGTGGSGTPGQTVPGTYTGVLDNITVTGQWLGGATSSGAVGSVDNIIWKEALNLLTLSQDTIQYADPPEIWDGTIIGGLVGATSGSTLAMTSGGAGFFAVVGSDVTVTGSPDPGDYPIEITETKAGMPNSPRMTPFTLHVLAA